MALLCHCAVQIACFTGFLQAGDAVGLTPARNAEVTSLAVTWAVLDATLTASTNTEDVLQVAEQVVQQIGELGDTSTERLQQCAVKTAAHAAACARLLQGAAPQAAASAAAAALKVGQKHKLPFNDVQCLAVAAAGRAATLDAMASCCSSEQAVRQAGFEELLWHLVQKIIHLTMCSMRMSHNTCYCFGCFPWQAAAAASRAAVDVGLPREKALECQALHAGGAAAHLATAAGKALDEAAAVAGLSERFRAGRRNIPGCQKTRSAMPNDRPRPCGAFHGIGGGNERWYGSHCSSGNGC